MYECRIERDSITEHGERLVSIVGTFPRFILAEVNTHRMFTRSSASSRAIPVEKQLKRLANDPFYPVYWGKNQKGMQASEELTDEEILLARRIWEEHKHSSVKKAMDLMELGVHKQIANRLLEVHMWHTAIISATDLDNFEHLRDNKEAQPEFREWAHMAMEMLRDSSPTLVRPNDWHLPFTFPSEANETSPDFLALAQRVPVSIGRCARVSYMTHDGARDINADIQLATERLRPSGHMAPFEHAARAMTDRERYLFGKTSPIPAPGSTFTEPEWMDGPLTYYCGNFNGWVQARKTIPFEWDALNPKYQNGLVASVTQ